MSGECWLWLGSVDGGGYGTIGAGSRTDGTRRTLKPHRITFADAYGEIPAGSEIHHTCENTRCVRPEHLVAVTRREHVMRHDGPTAQNARKTKCEKCGQDREYMSGGRRCRNCRNEYMRQFKSKRRARAV